MKIKNFAIVALLILVVGSLRGQGVCTVESDGWQETRLTLRAGALGVEHITMGGMAFDRLTMESFGDAGEAGAPNLPVWTRMIEIPLCDSVWVEEVSRRTKIIEGSEIGLTNLVEPLQPSRSKSDTSAFVLMKNNAIYSADAFYGNATVRVERIGVMRDRNLATVYFSPVKYNPASNELEVCTEIEVVVHYKNSAIAETREMKARYGSPLFDGMAPVVNDASYAKAVRTTAPVRYLIVAHSSFQGKLDSLVAWKRKKGFLTDIVYTNNSNVGSTTTSIAAYLKSQYTNATAANPAPTYVLLVGDVAQIPAFTGTTSSSHVTDLYYFTWTTGDNLPDCYYGRFSAQDTGQLSPQVAKTLMYERYAFPDPSFLGRAVLIAGVDAGSTTDNAYKYGDPAMDYAARYYVDSANGFGNVVYYKNNTNFAPTGVTVTGSSNASTTASTLRTIYNTYGTAWVNYTAHGSATSWGTPNFTTSHVSSMTNAGKFGFMIGNCCLTNKFNVDECLGEALLRKRNGGSVAYIGGSNSTYWSEDFYWGVGLRNSISNTMNASYNSSNLGMYDRLFHTHSESFGQWCTTAGSMIMAGNLAVESSTSSRKLYYWEIYHLMGDPSVMPWLGEVDTMSVSYQPSTLRWGDSSLTVTAAPYAYVALTDSNGALMAAAYANGQGVATLEFESIVESRIMELAVSAQNYRTKFMPVTAQTFAGPHVVIKSAAPTSNVETARSFSMAVTLENQGAMAADSVTVSLTFEDTMLRADTVLLSGVSIGPNSVAQVQFGCKAVGYLADQTQKPYTITVTMAGDTVVTDQVYGQLTVNAPVVEAETHCVETISGGENLTLNVRLRNNGHAALQNASTRLECPNPFISIQNPEGMVLRIGAGGSFSNTYNVRVANGYTGNHAIPLQLHIVNDQYEQNVTLSIVLMEEGRDAYTEDFEAGMAQHNWNGNQYPWSIDGAVHWSGIKSARSYDFGTQGNQQSDMSIVWTSVVDDSISFMYKVSSEQDYDEFRFFIDGTLKFVASGIGEGWNRCSIPVEAGEHEYTFRYEKDASNQMGSDCVWVDDISLPPATAQDRYCADTLCQGERVQLGGRIITADSLNVGMNGWAAEQGGVTCYYSIYVLANRTEIIGPTTASTGSMVRLRAIGSEHYQWTTGDTTAEIHITVNGDTTIGVTGSNGRCVSEDQITIRTSAGITSAGTSALTVYPNPASGVIVVTQEGMEWIEIVNAMGQTIMRQDVSASEATMNISRLSAGVYLVRTHGRDGETNSVRIVKVNQ